MARKPHNYVHFQNLVEELKSHNELNNEMIAEKLDQNNAILVIFCYSQICCFCDKIDLSFIIISHVEK